MRLFLPLLALIPLVAVACGGDDGDGATGSGGAGTGAGTTTGPGTGGAGNGGSTGLPCDVQAVLQQSCQSCHASSPVFGATMPLVTYEDLTAAAPSNASRQVYELVGERIHNDTTPMPPPPNERLSAADSATIDAWIAAGAPSSNESCGGGGGGGGGGGTTFNCPAPGTVQQLAPAAPYQMPQNVEDEYICYGVDVDLGAGKRHVISMAPSIDNATIVHHMLLFAADASYPSTPAPCGGASMGRLMGVWAPGGNDLVLPPEAGFAVEGTAHFVLQVHYSNLMNLSGQEDSSGYQLCVTDQLRQNDADIMAFGTTQINIPANGTQDITCNLTVPAIIPQVTVFAGMPHMHKLGTQISTTKNGATDLGSADPWNFESQAWTLLNTTIVPGDTISTRCAWNNTTPQSVGFGEQTGDEMCFGFVMYYPKVELAQWHWMLPAVSSQCSPTP